MGDRIPTRIIFILLIFISGSVFSQQSEYIRGRLFDSKSNEPVVFANIRIKDRALGIITNVDGSFKIPMRYKEYGDIIEISSMGYQTKEILILELEQDKLNVLTLEPSAIDLQEAVVKGKVKRNRNLRAKQIIQRAIDAIPRNYPLISFSTIGYYRDYQFKDQEYINLNEAILEVFDQGFDQLDDRTSEIRLFNFTLNTDFKQDSMARSAYDYKSLRKIIKKAHLDAYGGNEFRILRIHDAIRNYNVGAYDFVGALKTDLIKNHFFLRSSDTSIENEGIYNIKFWVLYPNYIANGNIYISKVDFAIHNLEYTMYNGNKQNKDRKKNKHGHRQKVIFDVKTDYNKVDDKMYLNYISFHNSFEVRNPPKFVLDSALVNAPGGCYEFYFNRPVDSVSASRHKNYDIIFKQRKFGIDKVDVYQNTVKVYPKMSMETLYNSMMEHTVENRKRNNAKELIDLRVKNIKDVDGNVVNQSDVEEYDQFREFFVQEVKPNTLLPTDSLFMDKRKPIFKDQPIVKPENFDDYWMNTPLQTIKN